ncbi:MAG: enoyl-CoA hydratase/isomerase family protein [Thermoflexaceae bacterium]|nr:enoyl-CoA hydratase/isomerase family protein [Thermoflexaceae bacterium]
MATWSEWKDLTASLGFEEVRYEKAYRKEGGGVARVSFNRPHRLNAFTGKGLGEFVRGVNDADRDRDVGVIIVSSVGDHFGTGGDVEWEASGGLTSHIPDFNGALTRSYKPTIAAIKGYCVGGSNHIAYHCDLTIAAHTAVFGQNGPRVGSGAADRVVSQSAEIIGLKRAREMWTMCRQHTAQQALEWGLINRVVPLHRLEDETLAWSDDLLDLVPMGVSLIKQSFVQIGAYLEQFRVLPHMGRGFFGSADQREAQQAFFEKRKPRFWPVHEEAFD